MKYGLIFAVFSVFMFSVVSMEASIETVCYPYLDRVDREIAQDLEQRHQLKQMGSGLLYLGLQLNGPTTEEEARYLLVEAVDLYVARLNADTFLAEHCAAYPFTSDDVEITLFADPTVGWTHFAPHPSRTSYYKEKITYHYARPRSRISEALMVKESYEEAKAILAAVGAT